MARNSSAVCSLVSLISSSILHANSRLSSIDDLVERRTVFNDYECEFHGMVRCLNCVARNTDRVYYLDIVGDISDGYFAFGCFIEDVAYPLISDVDRYFG